VSPARAVLAVIVARAITINNVTSFFIVHPPCVVV
jgi:hypothetical protein